MADEGAAEIERLRAQVEGLQRSQRLADAAGDILLAEQAERQAREQQAAEAGAEREERQRPQRLAMLHMPPLSVDLQLPAEVLDLLRLTAAAMCDERCTRERCPFRK